MTSYRAWIPDDVYGSEHARQPAARIVCEWSAHWIAAGSWKLAGKWAAADILLGDEWATLRHSQAISILGNTQSVLLLSRAILGAGNRPANPQDLKLMRRIAGEALSDLERRLDEIGCADGVPTSDLSDPEWVIEIRDGEGKTALKLLCSRDCLGALARQSFTRSSFPSPVVAPSAVLDSVEIECGVLLGRAQLPVDSLLALEIGDVVILDRLAADRVEMIMAGCPTGIHGTLLDQDGQLALEMQDIS